MDEIFQVKDFRSPSISRRREANAYQKYFGYRSTAKGHLGQHYHSLYPQPKTGSSELPFNFTDTCFFSMRDPLLQHLHSLQDPSDTLFSVKQETRIWTKRDMYQQRLWNISPLRPPHHYGRCRGCHERRAPKKRKARRRAVGQEIGAEDQDLGLSGLRYFFELLHAEAADLRLIGLLSDRAGEEEDEVEVEGSNEAGHDSVEDNGTDTSEEPFALSEWVLIAVTDAKCGSGGAVDDDWHIV